MSTRTPAQWVIIHENSETETISHDEILQLIKKPDEEDLEKIKKGVIKIYRALDVIPLYYVTSLTQEIKQKVRGIRKEKKAIYKLRYDNKHYLKWCRKYGTDPDENPWIDNIGAFPNRMPHNAWVDLKLNDGETTLRSYATRVNWEMSGLPWNVSEWRFHNSREKVK